MQVYMYAGIAKLNSDWLLHAEPMASKLAGESVRHHAALRGLLCRHEVAVGVCCRGRRSRSELVAREPRSEWPLEPQRPLPATLGRASLPQASHTSTWLT